MRNRQIAGIVGLTVAIFILDAVTPVEYVPWALYVIPILIGVRVVPPGSMHIFTFTYTALIVFGYFLSSAGSHLAVQIVNRIIGIAVIWTVSVIAQNRQQTLNTLAQAGQELGERTAELQQIKMASRKSEAKYRNLFESSMDAIFIHDEEGNVIDMNSTAYARLGYKKEEMHVLHVTKLASPEFSPRSLQRMRQVREKGFAVFESAHVRKDGTIMPVEINARIIEYEGRPAIFSIVRDITERKKIEEALRTSERRMNAILNSIPDIAWLKDTEGRLILVNEPYALSAGKSAAELTGKTDFEAWPRELAEKYRADDRKVMEGRMRKRIEEQLIEPNGIVRWIETIKTPFQDDLGNVVGTVGIARDITDRKRIEEEIRHMAQHDALTGLPNRRLFIDIAKLEIAEARRHRSKLAVLFLDLDRFKEVNDNLGHEVGDRLLRQVAERLRSTIRESDTVARIGGDEFNVLLSDLARPASVNEIAAKIVDTFREPVVFNGHELRISTSVGISIYPDDAKDIDTLLRYADMAMYRAKESGRNTFRLYNSADSTWSIERTKFEKSLRGAIERNEFRLYYQPLVNVQSGKIVAAEALLRWQHPEGSLLEPDQFMGIAERIGFMTEIDEWVLKRAAGQVKDWLIRGISPHCITINVSAKHFERSDLVARIKAILDETGVKPECFEIEITETMAMRKVETTAAHLAELANAGVLLSIDDFGTGYSSLSQLERLPIRKLKIDRSFVRDISDGSDGQKIIKTVLLMAHSMNLQVVAEGVENQSQLEFLRAVKCDEAQGYLFSKPVPAEEFEELVAA